MGYITQAKDYWIAPNAVNITLNALGDANRIQGSVASGAVIACYIETVQPGGDNGDGLGYGADRNPKRWPLSVSPTFFNTDEHKYIYVAIPRVAAIGTQAVVVFPSQLIDLYGKDENGEQIGSTEYFYIFLQGIISAVYSDAEDNKLKRRMTQDCDWGKLGTAQGQDEKMLGAEWYRYSPTMQVVTFLKNISMTAGATFLNLILGGKELEGVATSTTTAEYVSSERLVATPSYVSTHYLSKSSDDTASGLIGFLQGLWVKAKGLFGIDADGNAKVNALSAASDTHIGGDTDMGGDLDVAGEVASDDVHSLQYSDDMLSGHGYHAYRDLQGNGHITTDMLDVRKKARFAEVEIRRTTWLNAEQVQSSAASKVAAVLPVARSGQVIEGRTPAADEVWAWRCLELADDGTLQTVGGWRAGDQARCQTFNIKEGTSYNVSNKYYWRLVIRTGNGYVYEGKTYNWLELAAEHEETDPALYYNQATILYAQLREAYVAQNPQATDADTHMFAGWEKIEGVTLDAPATDDDVVQMGNQIEPSRMGFYMSRAEGGDTGPYIYAGVNRFALTGKMITKITPNEVLISSKKLKVFSNPNAGDAAPLTRYRGDWTEGCTSYYYDEWDYGESRWLYIGADEPDTEAPGTTADKWKEVSLKGDDGENSLHVEIWGPSVFRNGEGTITLEAHAFDGETDITSNLRPEAFSWERTSSYTQQDESWNAAHVRYGNVLVISSSVVDRQAVFDCIVDYELKS